MSAVNLVHTASAVMALVSLQRSLLLKSEVLTEQRDAAKQL